MCCNCTSTEPIVPIKMLKGVHISTLMHTSEISENSIISVHIINGLVTQGYI